MVVNSKKKFIRSPLFYVGDKYKIISQIKKFFPKQIDRFIEPFCGGGSVFLNTKANFYLINDIDSYVIKLHKFLISNSKNTNKFWNEIKKNIEKYNLSASYFEKNIPLEYKEQFVKTYYAEYNKESYIKMREDFNRNKNNILLLYLLVIYGFNRMLRFNSYGNFNSPVGNYLDPPYLIANSEYNKLWNEESEIRMIKVLDQLNEKNIKFAISNILYHRKKTNGTFNEWAKKYNIVKIKSNYISYHDNTKKDSVEVLVKNY